MSAKDIPYVDLDFIYIQGSSGSWAVISISDQTA